MAKRRYSDDFRAEAVVMLEAQGYPHTPGALAAIAAKVGVPARTLSRWFNKEQNPPPDQLVLEKKGEMVDKLDTLLDELVGYMRTRAKKAPLNQLAMTFGVAFDKKQLLIGQPTGHTKQSGHLRITGLEDLSDDDLDQLLAED